VNRPAYVWRVYALGMGAIHGNIPCWYVVDTEIGEDIVGGYDNGNNSRSGSAYLSRKRDAQAWLDGYLSGLAGDYYTTTPSGRIAVDWRDANRYADERWPAVKSLAKDDLTSCWMEGVQIGALKALGRRY